MCVLCIKCAHTCEHVSMLCMSICTYDHECVHVYVCARAEHYHDKIIIIVIIYWLITIIIKDHVINNRVCVIRNGILTQ